MLFAEENWNFDTSSASLYDFDLDGHILQDHAENRTDRHIKTYGSRDFVRSCFG